MSFTWISNISREQSLELIKVLKPLDTPIPSSQPGDWLSTNPEPGQTFIQFVKTVQKPINSNSKKIYLKPIGEFDTNQSRLLSQLSDYLKIFYQCQVVIEQPIPIKSIWKKAKRKRDGSLQINTSYINYNILYPSKPKDALAYMAITTYDLFPDPQSNFVFGQADQLNKVGVSSIARYDYPDSIHFQQTLQRIIKTSAHEIGHMIGIEHCIEASCLMNGSNSLQESDQQPQTLCADCFTKLSWRTQIDMIKRDSLLLNFYNSIGTYTNSNLVNKRLQILSEFTLNSDN